MHLPGNGVKYVQLGTSAIHPFKKLGVTLRWNREMARQRMAVLTMKAMTNTIDVAIDKRAWRFHMHKAL